MQTKKATAAAQALVIALFCLAIAFGIINGVCGNEPDGYPIDRTWFICIVLGIAFGLAVIMYDSFLETELEQKRNREVERARLEVLQAIELEKEVTRRRHFGKIAIGIN